MNKMILSAVTVIFLSACASKEPKKEPVEYKKTAPQITTTNPKPGPDYTSQMMASELGTDLVTEIRFSENSSKINEDATRELNELWKKAKAKGKITKVEFITWSDKEYPSKKSEELSDNQRSLAEARNKSLEDFFYSKDSGLKLVSVSMAERPGFLGRITASEEAEAKKSLQLFDIATTASKSGVSNSSRSIIMIFYSE